jgi:signal transduction histidine kinase
MTESLTNPKKILLISDSGYHQSIFNKLCLKKKFVVCEVVIDIQKINSSLSNSSYDLIIASSSLKDEALISYFHNHQPGVIDNTPFIFILQKKLTINQMKLFDKLKISFLYEDYIDPAILDYSLKTALNKQKELNLMKENELRYKSLYDHNLDINLITDNSYKVIDTNVHGKKQLKFKKAFELQSIFTSLEAFEKFIQLLHEVKQVSRFETKLLYKEKEVICLLDAFILYDSSKQRSGAHIVIRNIDAEKISQEIANRASKLMVTGKLLRSLAHEIRNPLTNINLALDELNTNENLTNDAQIYLDIVQRSANRVAALLEEIMNAYKTAVINLETAKLHDVIDNSLRFVNDRLILKNIKLKLSLKAKDDFCQLDKVKLSTAIVNLVVNACEAITHDHGEISITTAKNENHLVLTIKDNGCGMNAAQTAALFDPFYTRKSKGLGLGLTTSQNAIFAHKGSITVKSKENIGSLFIIKLPYKA